MSTTILCFFGKPNSTILSHARQLFTDVYVNKQISPRITSKTFSILLAIGDEYKKIYKDMTAQNRFYATLFYETPQPRQFLIDLRNITGVYNPTPGINEKKSVVVFDLDDTIITPELKLFYDTILDDILKFREVFDYVVLWTHGTELYLKKRMQDINFKFDLLMSRRNDIDNPPQSNKGMAAVLKQLNLEYKTQSISYAVLIDDKFENYNSDYDYMLLIDIQPTKGFYKKALRHLRSLIVSSQKENAIILASSIADQTS